MKKTILLLAVLITVYGVRAQDNAVQRIDEMLDAWHHAAAKAHFDDYFALMTPDAVYVGTDAGENWEAEAFRAFAKPYFDKGKAWSFSALDRNIYLADNGTIAWFDELLDTQMKVCRGSGVVVKKDGKWLVRHYVLSVTVPNDKLGELITIKNSEDDRFIDSLQQIRKPGNKDK